jgi:hypothetical protein
MNDCFPSRLRSLFEASAFLGDFVPRFCVGKTISQRIHDVPDLGMWFRVDAREVQTLVELIGKDVAEFSSEMSELNALRLRKYAAGVVCFLWRSRRDSNLCYRRERDPSCRNPLTSLGTVGA